MEVLIKLTIVMAILLAVYYLFLQSEKMYRFNRFYLIAAIVFSLALPFVTIPVYVEAEQPVENNITILTTGDNIITQNTIDIPATQVMQTSLQKAPGAPDVNYWPYIILVVYTLVTIAFLTRFAINIKRFYTIKSKSKTLPYRGATLVLEENNLLPHTFLNNIYLNKKDFERSLIEPQLFTHELTHVRQLHTLDILFIELLKIFLWFNPLLYLYKKAIQLNHEFLADEAVISKHKDVADYQELLLTKATPAFNYALSSSINFSLTKKRFAMMTKTTNLAKAIALKAITALVTTGLVYIVCVKTVAYAKETPLENKTIAPAPVESTANSIAEDIIEEIAPAQKTPPTITPADTIDGDARRDEYFRGVQIVIEDRSKNVFINKQYEDLTVEQKRYYLADVPEKEKPKGVSEEDFKFALNFKDAFFYVDDKKVNRENLLQRERKDFARFSMKMSGEYKPGGEKIELQQFFFYTVPYFNKNIKGSNDHFPEETYKVTILSEAVDNMTVYTLSKKKSTLAHENIKDQLKVVSNTSTYPGTENLKQNINTLSYQIPGGRDKFYSSLTKTIESSTKESRTDLQILFYVNTDGSISEVSIPHEKNEQVKQIVTDALKKSPKWIPAQEDGIPIKTSTSIKISFGENN